MADHGGIYVGEWDGPDPLMEMVAKARAVCRKPKGHDTALREAATIAVNEPDVPSDIRDRLRAALASPEEPRHD